MPNRVECRICGKSCDFISSSHLWRHGYSVEQYLAKASLGREPWNKNLTKEDDVRLQSVSEKMAAWNQENMTPEKRERIAQTLKKRYAEGMKIPTAKNGMRPDLGQSYRSTWEANYARIMKLQDKPVKYEPKAFPLYDKDGRIVCVYSDVRAENPPVFSGRDE